MTVVAPLAFGLSGVAPAQAHVPSAPSPSAVADVAEETAANGEPLTAADRDLLVKVRLAGLWENPAGRMAAKKGVSARVRQIGPMIASQHTQLDALVVKAAAEVGVELPDAPNADQQHWLDEMAAASGEEFDQIFVDRLRAAHGKVFPVIANVRSGTRNSVVRSLAQSANDFVLTHLTLLESTDLVDFSTLPQPPQPSAAASGSSGATGDVAGTQLAALSRSAGGLTVPVLVLLGVLALVVRLARRVRRTPRRTAARRYPAPVTPTAPPPYRRRGPSDWRESWGPDGGDRPWAELTYAEPDGTGPMRQAPHQNRPRY